MHTDWSRLSLWFFNCVSPIHHLNKLEYFIRPIKNIFLWIVGLLQSMFIYCICTQYLVGAPFALITASIRRDMGVISLWHCWGGMEAQVSLTVAFSSSAFFVSCFSFSSWQYTIDYLWGSGLVNLLASQAHQHHGHLTNWFWQCEQVPNSAGKWNQHI